MKMQSQTDAAYLREYVAFGSQSPVTVAECLHKALVEAHGKKEFGTVAHLQLRLFAEMVMSLESFGAMLLAYSRWDKPGGILGTLLAYAPGDVPKFVGRLQDEKDVLRKLCFPEKDQVRGHLPDAGVVDIAYTDKEAKKMIVDICAMYVKPTIRGAYNKIKHAGLCIRDPDILEPRPGKVIYGECVYLITYSKEKRIYEYPEFRVTGEDGIRQADKHLSNVKVISNRSSALAGFVAYFLEHNLLRPSV